MQTYLSTTELVARWAAMYPRAYNVRTVNNWRYLGQGPAYSKQAGRVLYALDDVKAYEEAGGLLRPGAGVYRTA